MDAPRTAAALGIDFGTHNTAATVLRADGRRHQLLFDGSPLLPSGIYVDHEASIHVGRDAAREGRRHPERYERNPKLRVGTPTILLGHREIPVPDAIAAVIGRAVSECARTAGPPRTVTVTVPAGWGPARRHTIGDAAASTGAGAPTLLPEPVGAARYFVEVLGCDLPPDKAVVVFDLGAGTFDASVVARDGNGYEVLAVDGSDRIGGHYLDQAIVDYLGGRFEATETTGNRWRALLDPNAGIESQRLRFALYDEVRDAKERLSRSTTTDVAIPGLARDELLTRAELELLARPLLAQAVEVTKAVLREARATPDRLAGVFMVGGASRMPLATTMLHHELGVAPTLIEQPELVVSEGAVSFAPPSAAATPAPAVLPPTPLPAPASVPPRRRDKGLIYALIALAVALLAAGTVLVYALGDTDGHTGELTAVDAADTDTAPASGETDQATDWSSVSVTAVETDAESITVHTDAAPNLTGCTISYDGDHASGTLTDLECGRAVINGLTSSSDYTLHLYGPEQNADDPAAEPLAESASTRTVTGTVFWDCPDSLQYCQDQGGEPSISPEPHHEVDAIDYAAVHEQFELICRTTGDTVVPRGSDEVDGYHDFHPGKTESDLWVRLRLGDGQYGYMPFVWLIIDHDDLDSTGRLAPC